MPAENTVTMPTKEYDKLLREHAKERVMEFGKSHKSALIGIGVGALGYWILTSGMLDKIQAFKDHWWLKSLLTLAIAWWLYRKGNAWSPALLTLGATMFVRDYRASHPDTETKGPVEDEAGAAYDWNHGTKGRWVKTASGSQVYVMDGGGTGNAAADLGDRVYAQAG